MKWLLFLMSISMVASGCSSDAGLPPGAPDGDTDGDTDADTDADSDTDGDTDTDTDSDGDTDTDANTDADSDTDGDTDTDTDSDTDTGCDRELMYVEGTRLYDANCNEFLPRGVNLQYGDYPPDKIQSIPYIAQAHANIVRLQIRLETTAAEFRDAVEDIVDNRMIAMPMMWDTSITCGTDPQAVRNAVNRWTGTHLSVLTDPDLEKYLLLNIANEWGDYYTTQSAWVDIYREVIPTLRDAGIRVPLVVDSLDCGHDIEVFGGGRGQQVIDADPLGQIIFSVHGYCEWDSASLAANFAAMNGYGYPWLLGEFGRSDHIVCDRGADHFGIMSRAADSDIGWMAWSWRGNGSGEWMLDMNNTYDSLSLTTHGNDIVYGEDGLMDTSLRATYWPDF
jgi:mannan endo-1,4-beta-mannosidase